MRGLHPRVGRWIERVAKDFVALPFLLLMFVAYVILDVMCWALSPLGLTRSTK